MSIQIGSGQIDAKMYRNCRSGPNLQTKTITRKFFRLRSLTDEVSGSDVLAGRAQWPHLRLVYVREGRLGPDGGWFWGNNG